MHYLRRSNKIALGLIIALGAIMGGGSFYQTVRTSLDNSAYPPPGELVDLGGYQMHFQDSGEGRHTVVLDAGMACSSLDWALVQPEIAKFARVVSYDRAGYGWSDESPYPRTSQNIVNELHQLLVNAQIPPPYILVGHSFGGGNMRLFASTYPNEVAGIVLVDAVHEKHFEKMPVWPPRFLERCLIQPPIATFGAIIGCVRVLNYLMEVNKMFAALPPETQDMYLANMCKTKYIRTVAKEFALLPESLEQVKTSSSQIKDKPLIVISAGSYLIAEERGYDKEYLEEITQAWKQLQADLVGISSKGKQMIAEKSGHMISHQQPDLIVEAVKEITRL